MCTKKMENITKYQQESSLGSLDYGWLNLDSFQFIYNENTQPYNPEEKMKIGEKVKSSTAHLAMVCHTLVKSLL